MNVYDALEVINDIAATSSRTEKQRILEIFAKKEFGEFVLKWTYDPMITFGLTPDRAWLDHDEGFNIELTKDAGEAFLRLLAHREVTGNEALASTKQFFGMLDKPGREVLFKILSKDLRCGIAETSIASVMPGLLTIISVQRAHKYEAKKVKKWPLIGEPKLDGMRVLFMCRGGNGGFYSRSGKRWGSLDHLVEPVIAAAIHALQMSIANGTKLHKLLSRTNDSRSCLNFVLDGEVMTGLFATTGKVKGKQQVDGAELHLFDIMSYDDFDAVGDIRTSYMARRTLLEEWVRLTGDRGDVTMRIVPRYYLNNDQEVQEFFERCLTWSLASYLARGDAEREAELLPLTIDKETGEPKCLEGAIVKNPDGFYEKKKSHTWMKLKAEETEDLPIVGVFNGEPGTKYEHILGGVIVRRGDVDVRVGGGFSDKQRVELWKDWEHDAAAMVMPSFVGPKGWSAPVVWAHASDWKLMQRLTEVMFHEVTPDGSLRHPRHKRFRDDKAGEVESREAA